MDKLEQEEDAEKYTVIILPQSLLSLIKPPWYLFWDVPAWIFYLKKKKEILNDKAR